jgi:hypothetical protein
MDLNFNIRVVQLPYLDTVQRPDYLVFPESDLQKTISTVMGEIPLNTETDANLPRNGATPTEKAVLQAFVQSYFYKTGSEPEFIETPYDPTMEEFMWKLSNTSGTAYILRHDANGVLLPTDENGDPTDVAAATGIAVRLTNMPRLADAKVIPGTNLKERSTIALLNYLPSYSVIRDIDDIGEFKELVYAYPKDLMFG